MGDIKFLEVDAAALQNELIAAFEEATGETLYPGDERRMFLLNFLPVLVGMKNDINESAKLNLLRYATGEYLDAIGGATERLPEKKATVTLKWVLSAAQAGAVTIPAGRRASPGSTLYFANTKNLVIPPGEAFGTVLAEATEIGPEYNGFTPGQISKIVDPTPYVASVTNLSESAGGANIEDDNSYRERIRLAPDSISTAGSTGGYEYWAKTADANISDVSVTSPDPGVTRLSILMQGGELPSSGVLAAVEAALSPKNRRPQSDLVEVVAATQDTYDLELIYYISDERRTEEAAIISAIEDTAGAVESYILWQKSRQGRAINPDYLRQLMLNAGANRIDVVSPSYTSVAADHVAKEGTVTITYGGLIQNEA